MSPRDEPSERLWFRPDVPTQRYKLTIAYRGTNYHGWQCQATDASKTPLVTIEQTLNDALRDVVRHPVTLCGSSRTDSGVHAKGQVAHFDTTSVQIPVEGLRRATNARLPDDIVIHKLEPVPETFHAIRDTLSKRYQYVIYNRPDKPIFAADTTWHRWQELNVEAMQLAADRLVGTHDFASFAKPGHGRANTVRTLFAVDVARRRELIVIGVHGSGFLWNMVRILVGTLVEVGLGRHEPAAIDAMIAAKNRRAAGGTAPPQGLYLQWIRYREISREDRSGETAIDPTAAG